MNTTPEPTHNPASIVRAPRVSIALFFAASAIFWICKLWPVFPRNTPLDAAIVVGVYASVYGICSGLALYVLWRLIDRILGITGKFERLQKSLLCRPNGKPNLFAKLISSLPVFAILGTTSAAYLQSSPETTSSLRLEFTDQESPLRIQLIGIDGADFRHIDRMIEAGELQNFLRFKNGGTFGPLETISPHSPVVWTSIATGRAPRAHGIHQYRSSYFIGTGVAIPQGEDDLLGRALDGFGFRVEGAVSSNERRVRAVWEILSEFDKPSLVVNWWASYPAEAIRGEMISNHLVPWSGFQTETLSNQNNTSGLTSPESLTPLLLERLNEYVEAHELENIERDAFTVAGYQYYKARDELVFEIYADRLTNAPHEFSLATVYLQGVDTASHAYTTEVFGENVNEQRAKRLSDAESSALWDRLVAGAYRAMDQRIGQLLDASQQNDVIILVSDHGWDYDGTSHWNKPDGIFMALGGPFNAGHATRAHVFDVLPTIASLLGLPISKELNGRVLRGTLAPKWANKHPQVMIESYGPRGSVIAVTPTSTEESHVDRLRDLGYVE
ncbi:MAG: hypothetical protein ACI87A_001208 [Planctomycetota bacterium]|jgi:hypothetical protein